MLCEFYRWIIGRNPQEKNVFYRLCYISSFPNFVRVHLVRASMNVSCFAKFYFQFMRFLLSSVYFAFIADLFSFIESCQSHEC